MTKIVPTEPAAHRALLAATGGILREVVELHRPRPYCARPDGSVAWWECRGCDAGAHAEDDPYWPCSTVDLIAGRLGVDLREDAYVIEEETCNP